jgi:hypothetical protein
MVAVESMEKLSEDIPSKNYTEEKMVLNCYANMIIR